MLNRKNSIPPFSSSMAEGSNPGCTASGYFVFNATLFPTKLDTKIHAQWREDVTNLLFGLELLHFIDGSVDPPVLPTTGTISDEQKAEFQKWNRQDRLLRHVLSASMHSSARPFIASARTARAVWISIENVFGGKSRSRVVGLKEQLHSANQGDKIVSDYIHSIKLIAEELSHVARKVEDEDLILHILHGLREEYCEMESSIKTRETPYTVEELHALLVGHEETLRRRSRLPSIASANPAFSGKVMSSGGNSSNWSNGPGQQAQSGVGYGRGAQYGQAQSNDS